MRRILPRKRGNEPAEEIRLLQEHFARGEKKGYEQGYLAGYAKGMETARAEQSYTMRPASVFNDAEELTISFAIPGSATQRAQVTQFFSLAYAWDDLRAVLSLRLDASVSLPVNCTMEPRTYSCGREIAFPARSTTNDPPDIDMLRRVLPRLWHDFPGEHYSLMTFLVVEFSTLYEHGHSMLFYHMAQVILALRAEWLEAFSALAFRSEARP